MTNISPIWLTIIFSMIAFFITSLGGAVILFFKGINQKLMQFILSFSAGVMIASSIFSLINVAIEQCESLSQNAGIVCTLGVFCGMLFIIFTEIFIDKSLKSSKTLKKYVSGKYREPVMSMIAISLHNIPEGLCIGVAFAGASLIGGVGNIMNAIALSVGIGLQNFPEGASVSLPLYNAGISKAKSFLLGMFSGVVEPIFAVIGFVFTDIISSFLPFLLTFAGGTMIAVSCVELLPESFCGDKNISTLGLGVGFCLMMIMDLML